MTMRKKYTTIVFDLGGVLIDWNPAYVYRSIFRTEESVQHFLRNVCTTDWNEQQDAGRSFSAATEYLTGHFPHYAFEISQYYTRWKEMLGGPIEPTVDFLRELYAEKKYRLVALTNWSAEAFPVARELYDFLGCFEQILVSGEEKMKKPDERIFRLLYSKFAIDPGEALFIDDNPHNVAASQATGMDAIRFLQPDLTLPELRKLLTIS